MSEIRTKAVGVTFHNQDKSEGRRDRQQILHDAAARGNVYIELKREHDNPHDENAISVWIDGEKIGHLRRKLAESIAPQIDQGAGVELLDCYVTGGTDDKPTYGLNLEFEVTSSR